MGRRKGRRFRSSASLSDLCGPCVKAEIGEGHSGVLEGAVTVFPDTCGYQLRMTATGRAIRFIVLIVFIALFVAVTRNEPRATRTVPSAGGGLPASGMGSPRPVMRRLGF